MPKARPAIRILSLLLLSIYWVGMATAGPVSWWRGEGNAQDSIDGNHGALVGGTSFAPGVLGQGFSFDGIDDGVNIPDASNLHITGSLTLEATINPSSYTGGDGALIIFRGDDRAGFDPYYLRMQPDGRIQFWMDDGEGHAVQLQSDVVPLNTFSYVAGSLDAGRGVMELRINGAVVASTFTAVRPLANLSPTNNPGVSIGNHNRYPPFVHNMPFHGIIDQVRIHNSFLINMNHINKYVRGDGGYVVMKDGTSVSISRSKRQEFMEMFEKF